MPYRPYSGCDEIKEIKVICQGKQGEKQLQLIVNHARSFDLFERFPYWINVASNRGCRGSICGLRRKHPCNRSNAYQYWKHASLVLRSNRHFDWLSGRHFARTISACISRPLWIIDGGDKKSADNLKQRNQSTLTSKKSPRNLTTVRSLGPDTTDACKLIMILTHLPLRVPMARSLPSQTNSQPALSSLEWDSAQTPVICLELLLLPALKKCRLCPSVCLV